MVVALLAVLKAGAAYVPLDPAYPAPRIARMLEDAPPCCVIGSAAHTAPAAAAGFVTLAPHDPESAREPVGGSTANPTDDQRLFPLRADHPAYVIYTSGSTGTPKGVVVPHRAVVNLVSWIAERFTPDALSRVVASTSLNFDVSVFEILGALCAGGCVELVPDVMALAEDSGQLWKDSLISAVPSALMEVLNGSGHEMQARKVAFAGEALTSQVVHKVRTAVPDASLANLYGPTETIHATEYHLDAGTPVPDGPVPIGRPLRNVRAYVLDRQLRPAPPGVTGELYLAGVGLARGYLKRPALTAERFVADPLGLPGSLMYRTGDLARRQRDGNLVFMGRTDHQTKIRGFRIEPGEVADVLAGHVDVAQAAVHAHEDARGERRLVAYLVPTAGRRPEVDALRRHATEQLPAYMVPSAFTLVDRMPLLLNGKLDQRALPDPQFSAKGVDTMPGSAREAVLCALFADVLGLPSVGVDDNFFHLGGHSLLGMRLTHRISKMLGLEVSIRDLFEAPTVSRLADRLDDDADHNALDTLIPLRPEGSGPAVFCVHPGSGMAWCYSGLIRHLPEDRPLYGLQAQALAEPGHSPSSVEEMAAQYVAWIRSVQPTGPYHMVGWSFGGLVAHAMASLLENEGEEVPLLCLLDCYPAGAGVVGKTETAADDVQDFALSAVLEALGHDTDRDEDGAARSDLLRRTVHGADAGPADRRPAQGKRAAKEATGCEQEGKQEQEQDVVDAMLLVFEHHVRLAEAFVPATFGGSVLFVAAGQDRTAGPSEGIRAWGPHVGGAIEGRSVDATHHRMMRPAPLEQIAHLISRRLLQ